MIHRLKECVQNEEGATLVEYSFLAVFIGGAVLAFFIDVNQAIIDLFPEIWEALSDSGFSPFAN